MLLNIFQGLGRPRPHNDDPKCHSAGVTSPSSKGRPRNVLLNNDLGVLMQEVEALTQKDCLFILRAPLLEFTFCLTPPYLGVSFDLTLPRKPCLVTILFPAKSRLIPPPKYTSSPAHVTCPLCLSLPEEGEFLEVRVQVQTCPGTLRVPGPEQGSASACWLESVSA